MKHKKCKFVCIAIIISLFSFSCTHPENTDSNSHSKFVGGIVVDSLTGQVIGHVNLSLIVVNDTSILLNSIYSDSNGIYILYVCSGCNSKGIGVVAEKKGYEKKIKTFNTENIDTAIVNFILKPISLNKK